MKVSIVIASYGKELFLQETLDSVASQSYSDIEIVLINDGSPDRSPEICEEFAKKDTRCVYLSQANQGVIAARNNGFKLCTGELILPFDADDTMPSDFVEKIVDSAMVNPSVTIFATSYYYGGKELKMPDIRLPDILFRNSISSSSAFRRSALYSVKGYQNNMKDGYEDWDFWIYFLESGFTAVRVEGALFNYRVVDGSRNATANDKKKFLKKIIYLNHKKTYDKWRPSRALFIVYPFLKLLKLFGFNHPSIRAISFFRALK